MTVAQLKRELYVGRELLVEFIGPNSRAGIHPRKVAKVQRASVAFDSGNGLVWLQWPKASDLREVPGGFEILEEGVAVLRYTFKESASCDH